MKYYSYITSHGGNVRSNNEDNGYLEGIYREDDKTFAWNGQAETTDSLLASVFDGMGGEENGEVASRLAASNMYSMKNETFSKVIDQYVANACEEIRSFAGKSNTGTTYAAVSIENNVYHFSNLGDSRGYLYRDNSLTRMTKDHNMVQELLLLGILTEEQAKKHPDRHTLYQYLGMKEDDEGMILEAHMAEPVEAKLGDICLLCSDGLTEMVSEEEIREILGTDISVDEKAEILKELALSHGGKDNVTILLIETE